MLYDALHQQRDLIYVHTTIMEAEVLHGRATHRSSQTHVDPELPYIPLEVHIAVHRNGLQVIDSLPDPEHATTEDQMDLFVHILTGALVHWNDLQVGEFSAAEIARDGLAKNPVLRN